MKSQKAAIACFGWAICLTFALAATAPAASSLSDALTGFTGDSTLESTQAAVAAAGFDFASTDGEVINDNGTPGDPTDDFVESYPTVVFDTNGASFGALYPANEGRNYMRTIEDDYAFVDWEAEVTVVVNSIASDDTWFGMGSGEITNWGTPDWAGVPGVFMAPQNGVLASNATDGVSGDWIAPPPCTQGWCSTPNPLSGDPGNYNFDNTIDAADYTVWRDNLGMANEDPILNNGDGLNGVDAADYDVWKAHYGDSLLRTHRLRMTFDADTKMWSGSIDVDYDGVTFMADATTLNYDLTFLFDDGEFVLNGFPTNPSKIYFGGDDGVIFKDFSVVVSPMADAASIAPEPSTILLLFAALGAAMVLQRQR